MSISSICCFENPRAIKSIALIQTNYLVSFLWPRYTLLAKPEPITAAILNEYLEASYEIFLNFLWLFSIFYCSTGGVGKFGYYPD